MRGERELNGMCGHALANLNLPRNSAKCHWLNLSTRRLLWLLVVEVGELAVAVWRLWQAKREFDRLCHLEHMTPVQFVRYGVLRNVTSKARAAVAHEAGDVVCFAMMVADRCGSLKY